jgi:hypothetical protein
VVEHINPDRFADSAGRPWEGRSFEENPFEGDDGSAPEPFLEVIKAFHQGQVGAREVVDQVRSMRLLVPLVASLGDSEIGAHGQLVDKSAELSIVTVKAPDDQDALVVFSSTEAMMRWNPKARPVPTDSIRVALAAASEQATRIVLDPLSDTEFVIRRPAIAKVAQSLPWEPPEQNLELREVIQESFASEPLIRGFDLSSGDPLFRLQGPELVVKISLDSGLDPAVVRDLVERVSQKWSISETFASSVDSVSVKLQVS